MTFARKLAVVGGTAAAAVLAMAPTASALPVGDLLGGLTGSATGLLGGAPAAEEGGQTLMLPTGWNYDETVSVIAVEDINVGPFQVCNNDVPVNVIGVQVPVDKILGVIGIGGDDNAGVLVNSCDQVNVQDN